MEYRWFRVVVCTSICCSQELLKDFAIWVKTESEWLSIIVKPEKSKSIIKLDWCCDCDQNNERKMELDTCCKLKLSHFRCSICQVLQSESCFGTQIFNGKIINTRNCYSLCNRECDVGRLYRNDRDHDNQTPVRNRNICLKIGNRSSRWFVIDTVIDRFGTKWFVVGFLTNLRFVTSTIVKYKPVFGT